MRCPHCNQEHPDEFKFCPITGKLMDCTNTEYSYQDGRFNKTRRKNQIEKTTDWSNLFPVYGVTLGKTDIHDLNLMTKIRKIDYGLLREVQLRAVDVVQRNEDSFINNISVKKFNSTKFPEKWRELLGLCFGMSKEECDMVFRNKGFEIKDSHYDEIRDNGYCVTITPDREYVIKIYFKDAEFCQIDILLYKCPYCKSSDVELSYDEFGDIAISCKSCGRGWGAVDDYVIDMPPTLYSL